MSVTTFTIFTPQNASADAVSTKSACLVGYTQCDFIHPRIAISAQYALMDMYRSGGKGCRLALTMLGAAQRGKIAGIYKEDHGKPALMARRHKRGWWQVVPKGLGATVATLESPPMMVFKKYYARYRSKLTIALTRAWNRSTLRNRTIAPLPPKGFSCAPGKKPTVSDEPPTVTLIPDKPEPPKPKKNKREERERCHKWNEAKHWQERDRCKGEYSPQKTGKHMLNCVELGGKCWTGDGFSKIGNCIGLAKCVVLPKPWKDFQKCLNTETDRYREKGRECNSIR